MTERLNVKEERNIEYTCPSRAEISDMLRDAGIRPTAQRIAIYEMLRGTTSHPKAETVYEAVKDEFPSLSLNTVYDTLEILVESGLVRKLPMKENVSRYDGNPIAHGHFVCVECGRVGDLGPDVDKELEQASLTIKNRVDGRVIDIDHRFYGYCRECDD
jgi:Fur family peroxide stress response transcriptional regulator